MRIIENGCCPDLFDVRPGLGDGPSDAPTWSQVLDDGSVVDWSGNRFVNVGGNDVSGSPVWVPEAQAAQSQWFFNPAVQQPELSAPAPAGFVEAGLAPPTLRPSASFAPAPVAAPIVNPRPAPVSPSVPVPSAPGFAPAPAASSAFAPADPNPTGGNMPYSTAELPVYIDDQGEGGGGLIGGNVAPSDAPRGGFPWGLLIAAALTIASR